MKQYGVFFKWLILLFWLPVCSHAAVAEWKINPEKSSIRFTGTQNDAPVKGEFKSFTGKIFFDPKKLSDSQAMIAIDMNSVTTSYKDFTVTLKAPEWFDVKGFPKATFEADSFEQTGENAYKAHGKLTIRDKTEAVKVTFKAEPMDAEKNTMKVSGKTTVNRLNFGVGQGEWKSTDEVANAVDVQFEILAKKE